MHYSLGAAVNQRDAHGSAALSKACVGGSLEVVKLLLTRDADPTIQVLGKREYQRKRKRTCRIKLYKYMFNLAYSKCSL